MAIHILHDREHDNAALVCSTSDWAFGPVFTHDDDHDAVERAEAFLRWLQACDSYYSYERLPSLGNPRQDARQLTDAGLERAYGDWLAQEQAQWQREADAEAARDRELFEEEA